MYTEIQVGSQQTVMWCEQESPIIEANECVTL